MRTVPAFSLPTVIPGFARLVAVVQKRADAIRRAWEGHRALADLARLDEHALKDIGLTRVDVMSALDAPLAEDPTVRLQRVVRDRRVAQTAVIREAGRDWS